MKKTAKGSAAMKRKMARLRALKGKKRGGGKKKVYDPKDKRMETPAQMKREGEKMPMKKRSRGMSAAVSRKKKISAAAEQVLNK